MAFSDLSRTRQASPRAVRRARDLERARRRLLDLVAQLVPQRRGPVGAAPELTLPEDEYCGDEYWIHARCVR